MEDSSHHRGVLPAPLFHQVPQEALFTSLLSEAAVRSVFNRLLSEATVRGVLILFNRSLHPDAVPGSLTSKDGVRCDCTFREPESEVESSSHLISNEH